MCVLIVLCFFAQLSAMLRLTTPSKQEMSDIGTFLTPPTNGGDCTERGDNWAATDTPTATATSGLDGSYTEVSLYEIKNSV